MTLGHETARWVHSLGQASRDSARATQWRCTARGLRSVHQRCAVGIENYCERPSRRRRRPGPDGGMAIDYLLVPHQRHLVPCRTAFDPAVAAPLTDAGLTPYHAIRRSWPKADPGCDVRADRRRRLGPRRGADRPGHHRSTGDRGRRQARSTRVGPGSAPITRCCRTTPPPRPSANSPAAGRGRHYRLRRRDTDDEPGPRGGAASNRRHHRRHRRRGDPMGFSQPYEVSIATTCWAAVRSCPNCCPWPPGDQVSSERTVYSSTTPPVTYRDLHDGVVTGRTVGGALRPRRS